MSSRVKRLFIVSTMTLAVAVSFWLTSRYPDLTLKGAAAPNLVLDGLGFDVVYAVSPQDSFLTKVSKRTINWLDTNKKGMAFGLVMAASLSVLFSLLKLQRLRGRLPNTFLGVAMGAPMGLCVNCAAPIAAGLHRSGSRLETSIALVLASPTLNVIVVSLLFTLLPWHMALLKVLMTLILLFLGVPAIAKHLSPSETERGCSPLDAQETEPDESWTEALAWSLRQALSSLWRLSWELVPLMVLAGFLGSLVVSVFPFGALAGLNKTVGPVTVLLVALAGTFLPVPMSFDVIICGLLYHSGAPVPYVMALLFTLGSFSVYSYAVFQKAVSTRAAAILFALVTGLGVVGAYAGDALDDLYRESVDARLSEVLQTELEQPLPQAPRPHPATTPTPFPALESQLSRHRPEWRFLNRQGSVSIEQAPLEPRTESPKDTLFQRVEGADLGLRTRTVLSYQEQLSIPMLTNRSVAAGDVHNDGWDDIVLANDSEVGGATLFTNLGGRFASQELPLGEHSQTFLPVVALVDINNDGWLDLFFSTILGENRLIINRGGSFQEELELPTLPGAFVNAVGFDDVDRDGDLDAVLGTWVHRFMSSQTHRGWNYLLLQENGVFTPVPLSGQGGNTNSVLLEDMNSDGFPDLFVANDFAPPDEFYWGGPKGFGAPVGPDGFPPCPEWTMSLDAADLDRDGQTEILAANIAFPTDARGRLVQARAQKPEELLNSGELESYRFLTEASEVHDRNRTVQDPRDCLEKETLSGQDLRDCLYDVVLSRVWRGDDRERWARFLPPDDRLTRSHFDRVFPAPDAPIPERTEQAYQPLPSQRRASALYRYLGGRFEDVAPEWGLETTFWSWNARFADFNLDGFQDLYIVTGTFQEKLLTPNLLYLGQKGRGLSRSETENAVGDYTPTACSTYLDFDNDGDLDIVTTPPNNTIRVFQNLTNNAALVITLVDQTGRHHPVGARVTVEGQMQKITLSGGYASFNSSRLVFGLGREATTVKSLEVRWPDGSISTLEGPFPAGHHYRIVREQRAL